MRILMAILMLGITAGGMIPLERRVHQERLRLQYGGAPVSLEMRDRVGQGMAMALLAGFRGVVADFVWIQSQGFWEKKEWLRQCRNIELATLLQPQSVLFWDLGAWHMAWNIGYAARTDPNNRTDAIGIKREREWHERARRFLARAIENMPHRYEMYFAMGWLLQEKFQDSCRAEAYFAQALQCRGAPAHLARLDARALERCGRKQAAYEAWKRLYRMSNQAQSIVERELRHLENELNVPETQRILPSPS